LGISVDELLTSVRPEVKKVYAELTDKWNHWHVNLNGSTKVIKHKKYKLAVQVNPQEKTYNLLCNFSHVNLTCLERAVIQIAYKLLVDNFHTAGDQYIFNKLTEQVKQIEQDEKPKKKRGKGKDTQIRETWGNRS
jgi:hypothetical protein